MKLSEGDIVRWRDGDAVPHYGIVTSTETWGRHEGWSTSEYRITVSEVGGGMVWSGPESGSRFVPVSVEEQRDIILKLYRMSRK